MTSARERSRAEIVRMRRREQSQKRVAQSTVLATRPLPPITSRGAATYVGPQRTVSPNTKHHFQSALSMPGIEVRMPMVQITGPGIRSRLFSAFLSLMLGTALYLAAALPEFRASPAQVIGNQRIAAGEINSVLGTSGQSIFVLTSSELETRLRLNYPDLVSVHVTIALPNTVTVSVVERRPVLLWQQGNGYTWIDADGVAFRPRGDASAPPATLIPVSALAAPPPGVASANDPLSPIPFISPGLVKAIRTVAPDVPQGSILEYDPKNGLGWSDSRGWSVFFGTDATDMPLKLQVYKSLVDSLTRQGIDPAFISVQYANAPYYRMSQ